MKYAIAGTALAVALLASTAANAASDRHQYGQNSGFRMEASDFRNDRRDRRIEDFRGRDIRGFERPEFSSERWREGSWRHEIHDGRLGWWWLVDDAWFFYDEPIYPYPVYIGAAASPPPPASPQVWYYCYNPKGYYPYVRSCNASWEIVPASPPQ